MSKIRTKIGRWVRGLLLAVVFLLVLPPTAGAQSPEPTAAPSVFDNMPGVVILLVPLAIGAALYLSYRLGRGEEETGPKREGAVSRALAREAPDVAP